MTQQDATTQIPVVGDGTGLWKDETFSREELQLAFRNRGMPLEGLRYPVTPTGMHYLLTHYDIPYVNESEWKLEVDGIVNSPMSLSLNEIKARPSVTMAVTMECAGNGRALMNPRPLSQPWLHEAIGTAEWTGTPLKGVMEDAGLKNEAVELVVTGLDRGVEKGVRQYYQRSLTISEAMRDEMMLVYAMNGDPLQPQHGFPLRLIVPGWYGMTSVKWLDRIEAVSEPFQGYQMQAYSYRQAAGETGERVDLIKVRALMVPPGIPDFLTRTRLAEAGRIAVEGKAWAGRLGVSRVEVSADGGETWSDATLGEQVSKFAWRSWSFEWNARPGRYKLCVRATDTEENVQPIEQAWNLQGMGNNMSQQVDVIVE